MILMDFSQLFIRATLEHFTSKKKDAELNENFLRHVAITTILSYKNNKKFSRYWSSNADFVICIDGKDYWRKKIFPNYKKHRHEAREQSEFDWNKFYQYFNQIKEEFRENLPFYFIEVNQAEADDIIALACEYFCGKEHILIISSDKDFIQIQQNICPAVKQFSPVSGSFIDPVTNEYSLFEHIVRGDSGDGIPNILSDDDVFLIKGKRSRVIRKDKLDSWREEPPESFCESLEQVEKFYRNKKLIDLREIDLEIKERIYQELSCIDVHKQINSHYFNYLVKHKLMRLIEQGKF